jgi:ABC-type uncharacterized transport system auxiliary subunit
MINHSKLQFALGFMTALVSLTGCGGKIRYSNYYVLNVPAPPTANDGSKPVLGSVAVRQFTAPSFLKEGSIVYRPSAEQLEFYNFHRWAEDPRRVATQAMARQIQARGLFNSVDIFDGRSSPDYLITGTLDHLEEVDQGSKVSIEVGLSARLINLRTGEELWRDTSTKTATLDDRSVPGIVSELSRELGSAMASLASSMQDRLSSAASLSGSSTEQGRSNNIR